MQAFGEGRTRLRPIARGDLDLLRMWRNHDQARVWFRDSRLVEASQQQAWYERYIGLSNDITFAVITNHVVVGFVAIYDTDEATRSAEIGRFLVSPDHRGKGYMADACRLIIQACRDELELSYLRLVVHQNNAGAIALYRANGFDFSDVGRDSDAFKPMRLPLR